MAGLDPSSGWRINEIVIPVKAAMAVRDYGDLP
jgi:hypothetical protein